MADQFTIKQRIKELEQAIARDPTGEHSDVTRREKELEDLKAKLK